MAELVIKIPEDVYGKLLEEQHLPNRINLEYYISHGTPLPKGHGRLIDADVLVSGFEDNYDFCEEVNATPTIIEADKEEE